MTSHPPAHHRQSIRLKGYDYTQPAAYLVTILTYQRQNIFGEIKDHTLHLNELGQIAFRQWKALTARFQHINLDEYVVMPNHIHGIIILTDQNRGGVEHHTDTVDQITAPQPDRSSSPTPTTPQVTAGSLGAIVRLYKSAVTYRIHGMRNSTGLPVWHRNYYEHIIRDAAELNKIRLYIQTNPESWGEDQLHPTAPPNRFNYG